MNPENPIEKKVVPNGDHFKNSPRASTIHPIRIGMVSFGWRFLDPHLSVAILLPLI
jgi:hypothetical protein